MWERMIGRHERWGEWACAGSQCRVRQRTRHDAWITNVFRHKAWATRVRVMSEYDCARICADNLYVFGAESAIRPDSLQRAGALGLLHRLLAMDVLDAEGFDDCAEGEDTTRGNGRWGTVNNTIRERDGCETLWMTRDSFCLEPTLEMCGWCAVDIARETCACVRVRWGGSVYTLPSRSVSCVRLDAKRNLKK